MKKFIAHIRESDNEIQTVKEHCYGVSEKASIFSKKIGLSSFGKVSGLLHDLGKYSEEFQDYILNGTPEQKGKIDHSSAGAQFIWNNNDLKDTAVNQLVSLCISSHHSGLIDNLTHEGEPSFRQRMSKVIPITCNTAEEKRLKIRAIKILESPRLRTELEILCREIGNLNNSEMTRRFALGLVARFLLSSLIDADRLDTINFSYNIERQVINFRDWDILGTRLERYIETLDRTSSIGQIRYSVAEVCINFHSRNKGTYKLTVPTGGGKTLSSLRFAIAHANKHKMDRVIYIAPYISILDQNAEVAREALERDDSVVLEHHSNLTKDNDTYQNRILAENWNAPVVFTTAVQFLETLFGKGTRSLRRMHQLANSVIIFDEIQSLPIRIVHMFNNASNFLTEQCGSTVVLCTATQPLLDNVDKNKGNLRLSPNPEIISNIEDLFTSLKRVEIIDKTKPEQWNIEEVAEEITLATKELKSVLVIVNTKPYARDLYQRCKLNHKEVHHLSTFMCPEHRSKKIREIKECLKEGKPIICISTQLIEAGVDISFGTVIRSLAGLDSIVQASGRCNRNKENPIGKTIVVNVKEENLGSLPEIIQAQSITKRIFSEYRHDPSDFDYDLLSPKALNLYYKYSFFDNTDKMDYPEKSVDSTLLSLLSTNIKAKSANERKIKEEETLLLEQSFSSAAKLFEPIASNTQGVIVPYEKGKEYIETVKPTGDTKEKLKFLRLVQRYSIDLELSRIEKLKKEGIVKEVWEGSDIYYLESRYYTEALGFNISSED